MLVIANKSQKRKQEEVYSDRDAVLQNPMNNLFWGDEEVAVACGDSESTGDWVPVASDTYCYYQSMVLLSE